MRKPTKRVRGRIVITYQVTDVREERLINLLQVTREVIELSRYPHEFLNPDKGDYISMFTNRELDHETS